MQKTFKFSIAPMLDWTDEHFRYFANKITKHALLYTEMIVADSLIHGNRKHFLNKNCTNEVAFQIAGGNSEKLKFCAPLVENAGFTELNLNCGCPSGRVMNGNMGASLMLDAKLVANLFKAMQQEVSIPVTIKHRIGVDKIEDYEFLKNFVEEVASNGCKTFIIHARNAILHGLSTAQNREIPPLKYNYVFKIKEDFPDLNIILNGGITSINEAKNLLKKVDGVMMGRSAYRDSHILRFVDSTIFLEDSQTKTRTDILLEMIPYIENHVNNNGKIHHITKHFFGFVKGIKNAGIFRRILSKDIYQASSNNAKIKLLIDAINLLEE